MRELVATLGVPQIQQQIARTAEPDPMQEAVQRRRALMATRMDEAAAQQLSAQERLDAQRQALEAQELELRIEATQAKLEQLRAERRQAMQGVQGTGADAMAAMLQVFETSQQRILETTAQREQTLLALLNDRIEAAQQAREQPPPAPLPTLTERVAELRALMDIVDQVRPRSPVGQGLSVADQLALEKFNLEADERRHALAQQAALQLRQLQGQEQHRNGELVLRQAQIDVERARNEKMGGLIEQLAPGVLAGIQQAVAGGGEGGAPQQHQPAGDLRRCINCQGEFWSRPEQRGHAVHCPHCHQVQLLPAA